ncbi:MAG: hypothetical protein QXT73_06805 [Candidatus Methanomethylicaceae archaeon]
MNIGKEKEIRRGVEAPIPVELPREKPIPVPNWPKPERDPAIVPVQPERGRGK